MSAGASDSVELSWAGARCTWLTPAALPLPPDQKYEFGIDRVPAASLFGSARFLQVPVSYFFAGLPFGQAAANPAGADEGLAKTSLEDRMRERETLELVRAYYRIASQPRRKLYVLICGLADTAT